MAKLAYKRVLLKISGEALMGPASYGIDLDTSAGRARSRSVEPAPRWPGHRRRQYLPWHGRCGQGHGPGQRRPYGHPGDRHERASPCRAFCSHKGVDARVLSAIAMPTVCETYSRDKAVHHLEQGRVVICAAGTGLPVLHDRYRAPRCGPRRWAATRSSRAPASMASIPPIPRATRRPSASTGSPLTIF